MIKTILISQFALPFDGIGSWTTMYNYYLEETDHKIDIILCPKPSKKYKDVTYYLTGVSLAQKVSKRINRDRYFEILKHLDNIINDDDKYIIQLIDNHGIVETLDEFLTKKGVKHNCFLQFFYHGFSPFYGNFASRSFFQSIDEHVNLTMDSYRDFKTYYSTLPCRFSVQHNGVDRKQFKPLSTQEKTEQKIKMNVANKTVFLWCSQDRPKKGLDFILDVWKRVFYENKQIELWVVGAERNIEIEGVRFFGRIPNKDIALYFQTSDIYLYPSLWKEGFGLTLIEALACGNLCIASENGGIPEVLNYGEYGVLISRPNFIEDWAQAILQALNTVDTYKLNLPEGKYDLNTWSSAMNQKIENAKLSLS